MIIVDSELSHLNSQTGICDQCGKFMYGRCVTGGQSVGGAGSRGTFFICFDCMAPVVRWKKAYNSMTIHKTPVNHSDYEDVLTKLGGRPTPVAGDGATATDGDIEGETRPAPEHVSYTE